jgi:glycosyltransferase involved in cell wall biosynthesis
MTRQSRARRVLIVTSSYAPITIADMHRARHLAWELPKRGWDTELLYPNVEFQRPEYLEPTSEWLFDPDTSRHEAAPISAWVFRLLKMRSVGWRALWPLYRAGVRLLRQKRFDLVYITTAHFPLFCIGRGWARRFNVPYVLDYHDPWVRDEQQCRTTPHTLKWKINALLSRRLERYALEGASGVVSVSPSYLAELRARHGNVAALGPGRTETIPFAARTDDFPVQDGVELSKPGRDIVYVGAGGSIMANSFAAICETLAAVRREKPELLAAVKCRLYGTYAYWKEGDPKPLLEIATRFGLADIVEEHPARVSYVRSMELAQRSDALLVLGVDDEGYMPSKLFTYALSGKPLLASLRSDSPARRFFDEMPGLGNALIFGGNTLDSSGNVARMKQFLCEVHCRQRFDRRAVIEQYMAPAMAGKHAALFERICAEHDTA